MYIEVPIPTAGLGIAAIGGVTVIVLLIVVFIVLRFFPAE